MKPTIKITEEEFTEIKEKILKGTLVEVLNKKLCPLSFGAPWDQIRTCSTACAFSSTFIGRTIDGFIIEFYCRKNGVAQGQLILVCKAKVKEETNGEYNT